MKNAIEASRKSDLKRFEITYYHGPQNEQLADEFFIRTIAEGGFTSIPLEDSTTEINKKALSLLRKYGMTCSALSDPRIAAVIGFDRNVSPDTPKEEVDRIVAEVVADYADYMDVIEGWLLQDEPCEARFPILAKVVSAFRTYSPDKNTMINLYPDCSGPHHWGSETYKDHLDRFVETVNPHYLSNDNYHFYADGTVRANFFTNLKALREKAMEAGIDPMIIILLTCHWNYANVTHSQLIWEINTALTYGMKRISYFTFWLEQLYIDENWTNACMNDRGEIYPHYYDVQKVNKWLLPLGRELFDKTSTGVFHLPEKEYTTGEIDVLYEDFGGLGGLCGTDFVIGFFDDGSFMITNKRWREGEEGRNTLEFKDVKNGLLYFDPEAAEWKSADGILMQNPTGTLTARFAPGEGILFKLA